MDKPLVNTPDSLAAFGPSPFQGTAVFGAIWEAEIITDFLCSSMSFRFKELFGNQTEDVPGRSITQFTSPAEAQALLASCKQVLINQQPLTCRHALVQPATGITKLCELTLTPLPGGIVLAAVLVPNQQLEQLSQMQVLENSFNACLNGITVYQAICDAHQEPTDFRIAAINEVGLKMSSLSREQVVGKTLRELYPPTDTLGLFAVYKHVFLTGQLHQGEHFYVDYGVWRQLVIVRISGGVMATYHDITSYKQLQHDQEQLINQLIRHAPGGALLLEPIRENRLLTDLRLVRCNETYAQLWNKGPDQLSGQVMSVLSPSWPSTALFGHIQQVLTTGEPYEGSESRVINGEVRYAAFRLVPVGNFLLVTYEDQTQLYQQQNQIKELVQDLHRAGHNLHEFAFVASHDLQEPLRKIQQFSGLLADQYSHQLGGGSEYLERMRGSAERLSQLLKELLSYSRLTTQLQVFKRVDLSTLIDEVLKELEVMSRKSGAQVTIDPLPLVDGDATQLELLFHHLLSNSIKFVNPGESPRIRITSESVPIDQLPVRLRANPTSVDYLCLRVIDEGIGFEQKHADRIFGLFQRLHSRQHYTGTGIGLAVCQRIVENHRGAIIAQSEVNRGTVISIFLPKHRLNTVQ